MTTKRGKPSGRPAYPYDALLQVRVPRKMLRSLQAKARKQKTPASVLVREAIEKVISK